MSSDLLNVSINPDGYVEVSNGLFNKKISIKDFASVVNTLVSQEDQVLSESTFRYPESVHSVTRTNQGYILNLYYKEREADVSHVSLTGPKTIYMPNVMIRVELNNVQGKPNNFSLGNIWWFATDKDRISLPLDWPTGGNTRDHIWTLPLPNMYDSAQMCTGGNQMPSVIYQDWTVLDMLYYDVLIKSSFNNDLDIRSVSSDPEPGTWIQELHDHWVDEESARFPYDRLVNY